jgi:hypothetical protein
MSLFTYISTAAFAALCLHSESSRKLSALLVRFVLAFALLHLESLSRKLGYPGPLPRDLDEVIASPLRLERILKSHSQLSSTERIVKITKLQAITSEPAKQLTAGSIRVSIGNTQNEQRELDLFCKFQTGRHMPTWLQAMRIAAEPGVYREVDFYSQVQLSVPVQTIKPVFALKSVWFNYVFIALEHVPLSETASHRVINDAIGATQQEVTLMMTQVAKLHRRFVGDALELPELSWIPARTQLDFAKWVTSFLGPTNSLAFSPKMWSALNAYFAGKPVRF